MKEIKEAYQQCGQIVSAREPACYKAFSFLPLKQRQAPWAVMAFYHTAPNADEKALSAIEAEAEDVFSGTYNGNHFLWKAFDHAYQTFTLDSEPFREFIAAQKAEDKPFGNLDELLMHAYQTGGGQIDLAPDYGAPASGTADACARFSRFSDSADSDSERYRHWPTAKKPYPSGSNAAIRLYRG